MSERSLSSNYSYELLRKSQKGYEDFTESIYTLSQLYLGVFDFEELVNVSPVLGAFMFVLFTLVSVVVLMTALLKLVDVSFLQVLHETPNNAVNSPSYCSTITP